MSDSFAFAEGELYLWTGTNPSSAIAFVQDFNGTFTRGIQNIQGVNGNYTDILTGQRVDVSFTPTFTTDLSLWRMFMSPTAVHMKLNHAHSGGSAGYILYSGVFESFGLQGREGDVFTSPVRYHANVWSAYGS